MIIKQVDSIETTKTQTPMKDFNYKEQNRWNSIFAGSGVDSDNNGVISDTEATEYINKNEQTTLPKEKSIVTALKGLFGKNVDGDIEGVKQGQIGDCWLIAPLVGMNETTNGKENLKKIVKQNDDNTVTVTFFGSKEADGQNWQKTISNKEIAEFIRKKGASDNDVAAIEMAFNDYQTEKAKEDKQWIKDNKKFIKKYDKAQEKLIEAINQNPENKKQLNEIFDKTYGEESRKMNAKMPKYNASQIDGDSINGNNLSYALDVIVGAKAEKTNVFKRKTPQENIKECTDAMRHDNPDRENKVCTIAFKTDFQTGTKTVLANHAYTLISVVRETATLRNPHGDTFAISLDKLKQNCNGISLVEIPELKELETQEK